MLIGNYTVTNDFSISFDFTGDYWFDSKARSIFWTFGTMQFHMEYPDIRWFRNNGNQQWDITLDGIGVKGYYYYKDNPAPINITCVYDRTNSEQRIYVDGYLLASLSGTLPAINATLDLRVEEGNLYELFSGTISNVTFYNTALSLPVINDPIPQFRVTDYPYNYIPGSQDYSAVSTPLAQLNSYQDPQFLATTSWTGSALDLRYLAGGDPDITPTVITNAVALQTVLSDKYRYVCTIATLEEYYGAVAQPAAYNTAMINLAIANPSWTTQITSALANQIDIPALGLYVIDGHTVQWSDPLTVFDDTRNIYDVEAAALVTELAGRTVDRHIEDDEVLNRNLNSDTQLQITQKFVDRWNYILQDMRGEFPGILSTVYDIHDTTFWSSNGGGFPNNLIIDPGVDATTDNIGSISCYPERPSLWYTYQSGNLRGIPFYLRSKYYEIQAGYPLNNPFVKAGSDIEEEKNIRPAQWLGFLKVLKTAGVDYFTVGYFTTAGIIQNPKGYVWQATTPAYVDGLFSDPIYSNIIYNGDLMEGDTFVDWNNPVTPLYNFYTGDKSLFCVIRKLGTEYLITITYQPLNNYIGQLEAKDATITFDGNTFTLEGRRQGSVYYWDSAMGGSPTQIDTWHESTHPERWASITPPPDTTAPVVDTPAGDLDAIIYCTDFTALAAALALQPTATDNIDPNPTIQLISDTEVNPGGCPNQRIRIWNFIDSSGNVSLNFTQTITFIPLIASSDMNERLIISTQLEPSLVGGSLVVTDSQNEQFYLPPDTNGQVLTLVGGFPTWADPTGGGGNIIDTLNDTLIAGNDAETQSILNLSAIFNGTDPFHLQSSTIRFDNSTNDAQFGINKIASPGYIVDIHGNIRTDSGIVTPLVNCLESYGLGLNNGGGTQINIVEASQSITSTANTHILDNIGHNSKVGVNIISPVSNFDVFGTIGLTLTNYANNAAAITGGLVVGQLYRTAGAVMIVV